MTRRASKSLLVLAVFICGLFTGSALANNQVRIVRLSDLDGDVSIDHGTGYQKALRNMPITQGTKLWTKSSGLAEVEFENGSTVRLTPNTIVSFPQLAMSDSGSRISTVELTQGTAYFNTVKQKNDDFTVKFAGQQTVLKDSARFRVDLNDKQAKVAVISGEVQLQGPAGEVKVAKNHTATFDVAENGTYEVAKGLEPDQYDTWNSRESQYQKQYDYANAATGSWPYSYGLADLNYYGNYFYQPGWGWLWQPYFTGANWDPFMDGSWVWYPGAGYTFVSGYPWGWLPYRYGNWALVPGWGWCWQPGGFYGWNAAPVVVDPPAGFRPPPPPATTAVSHPTVPVGHGRLPAAEGALPGTLGLAGGRPGRVVTGDIPIHGGGVVPGFGTVRTGIASPGMVRGTYSGPRGTYIGPKGTVVRGASPRAASPRMSSPGMGSMGTSHIGGSSSASRTSSSPHR